MTPRLLDLFCGAGGATRGYQLAGFHVTGVDIEPQPNYCGDDFIQADALTFPLDGFDVVHASPPCQAYGTFANINRARGRGESKAQKLIEPVRARLSSTSVPYVIENTERAPLLSPIKLCGSSFGLRVRRHRLFESNVLLMAVRCVHKGHRSWDYVGVYGSGPGGGFSGADGYTRTPRAASLTEGSEAMGIDWMTWDELREAIPPAYTQWVGQHLMAAVLEQAGAA